MNTQPILEALEEFQISQITVADDNSKNTDSARQFVASLEGIDFQSFGSAHAAIAEIETNADDIGLLLTDLSMESPEAGLDVLLAGWQRYIPTFVVSGGYKGHGVELIRLEPGMVKFAGSKDCEDTWLHAMSAILLPGDTPHETFKVCQRLRHWYSTHSTQDTAADINADQVTQLTKMIFAHYKRNTG